MKKYLKETTNGEKEERYSKFMWIIIYSKDWFEMDI